MFNWFRSNDEKDMSTMTKELLESTETIMKRGMAANMKFENFQKMSSEDFELMRECSKLWTDSTEYAFKAAAIMDMIPEIKKEQETIKKQLAECQSLLREIASKREA